MRGFGAGRIVVVAASASMRAMDGRRRVCGKCGYDLAGVNRLQGACPECGNYFDVMSGKGLESDHEHSARHKMDRLLARARTVAIGAFTLIVLALGMVASRIAVNPYRPLAIAGLIALVGALATVTSFLYEREDR